MVRCLLSISIRTKLSNCIKSNSILCIFVTAVIVSVVEPRSGGGCLVSLSRRETRRARAASPRPPVEGTGRRCLDALSCLDAHNLESGHASRVGSAHHLDLSHNLSPEKLYQISFDRLYFWIFVNAGIAGVVEPGSGGSDPQTPR
jgi:hypothetical protein